MKCTEKKKRIETIKHFSPFRQRMMQWFDRIRSPLTDGWKCRQERRNSHTLSCVHCEDWSGWSVKGRIKWKLVVEQSVAYKSATLAVLTTSKASRTTVTYDPTDSHHIYMRLMETHKSNGTPDSAHSPRWTRWQCYNISHEVEMAVIISAFT